MSLGPGADFERERLEQARAGSAEAFADIVRLHQARVRAFLGRFVRDPWVAEDLAQDTFLTAFRTLSTFRGESPLRHWLLGIARHRALVHFRDETRRRPGGEESAGAALAGIFARRLELEEDPARQEERVAALRACLESLAPASREMVREFYFRGQSAGEIARTAGKKEGAVWMSLLRIRQALRQCVETRLGARGAEA